MRKGKLTTLLCTCLALLLPSVPAFAQKPRAERPTYSVGDRWLRSDGAYDLIRIDNDLYIFSAGPGQEIHLTRDLMVAKFERARQVVELAPPPRLSWPLEVGKWGESDGTWRTPDFLSGTLAKFTWGVDAYEDVRVPAGTFKAFRISLSVKPSSSLLQQRWPGFTGKIWYAPEARQIVKGEGRFDIGLPDFQLVALDRPLAAPLQVVLQEPRDQARVSAEGITLAGKVTSGRGVTRVTVALNDQEVSTQGDVRAPKNEVALNLPIKLGEGKNVLLVTAADSAGNTRQEVRTLFYDKPKPPVAGGPTPSPPPVVAPPSGLRVALSSPADQARVDREGIAVAGVVSGGTGGVSRVVISLNGVEVARVGEPTAQPFLPVNLPITLREGPNTLVLTATDAAGAVQQEIRTVHYEQRIPLTVSIRYPEDKARLTEAATVVAALATSSQGIAKVSVNLNGNEVSQQSERTPQKSMLLTAPVTLREGTNTIEVIATEKGGAVRRETRTVIYDRPAGAGPAIALKPSPIRGRWAVVIGIGRYERPEIPALRYSVADAEAFYEAMVGQAGFKKENVLLLTDKTERKPTLRNIKWALGTFLARSARKDDLVAIYFAGHGAPEVDPRGVESDGLAKYLVPMDADPDDLYSTALPMDEVQTIFGRIEAEQVVAFLDACYSGAAGGRTFASKRTRASKVDDVFLERLTRSKGRVIVTASRSSEVSIELPELGHGIFTHYLVQGLKGTADLDRDGIVSLQELYQYLEQEVSRKSRAVGGNQHPVMKGELEGLLPLAKVGGR